MESLFELVVIISESLFELVVIISDAKEDSDVPVEFYRHRDCGYISSKKYNTCCYY